MEWLFSHGGVVFVWSLLVVLVIMVGYLWFTSGSYVIYKVDDEFRYCTDGGEVIFDCAEWERKRLYLCQGERRVLTIKGDIEDVDHIMHLLALEGVPIQFF